MPLVHLLSPPGSDLREVRVVCGVRMPERGSWSMALVDCPACLRKASTAPGVWNALPEKVFQEQLRQLCTAQKWLYFHVHNAKHSPSGFPDLAAIRHERLIAAELKRVGNVPTAAQAAWLAAFAGVRTVETYVWTPEDMPTILEVLR